VRGRQTRPLNLGEMAVDVEGELKPETATKIIVRIITFENCTGTISLARLPVDFELQSDPFYSFEIFASDEKSFIFEFVPKKSGEYLITIVLLLSVDRVDSQELRQKLILRINGEDGGITYFTQ
jgi:hypothetical protein